MLPPDDNDIIPMIPDENLESVAVSLGCIQDYNHDLSNVPSMWKLSKGAGVKVAILDTGMPMHKDITVTGSKSFIPEYLIDENGHSTGVGSIIAGVCQNNIGIIGVAPEVDDYYGAVLNASGSGSLAAIADGVRWAVDEVGADVINMSLGTPHSFKCNQKLKKACQYAYDAGVTIVAAAGNDASEVNWPAALDTVIAVAAVDRKLKAADFSSRGPEVEFAAGGVNVMTAYKNNEYASHSGTSFSAPVISGIVSLIIAEHKLRGIKLTPEQVRQELKAIAYDIGEVGRDTQTGWGVPVFTKDTSTATGKPGKPVIRSWLSRLFQSLKWW